MSSQPICLNILLIDFKTWKQQSWLAFADSATTLPSPHPGGWSQILTRVAGALNEVEGILSVSYWHLICICKWNQSVQTQESRNANDLQIGSSIKHLNKHGVAPAQLQYGDTLLSRRSLCSPLQDSCSGDQLISEKSVWKLCRKC